MGPVAQQAERTAFNRVVAGSNPAGTDNIRQCSRVVKGGGLKIHCESFASSNLAIVIFLLYIFVYI